MRAVSVGVSLPDFSSSLMSVGSHDTWCRLFAGLLSRRLSTRTSLSSFVLLLRWPCTPAARGATSESSGSHRRAPAKGGGTSSPAECASAQERAVLSLPSMAGEEEGPAEDGSTALTTALVEDAAAALAAAAAALFAAAPDGPG